MRPLAAMALTTALLALAAAPARPDADDPEPPPPVKVEVLRGAKVKARSGRGGPVVELITDFRVMGKGKLKAKLGKGKLKTATATCTVSFTRKEGPSRLTLRFKTHQQLTYFYLRSSSSGLRLSQVGASGEQVHYATANGALTTDAKQAALIIRVVPGKKHLDVRLERPKGKSWPGAPWTVAWRGPVAFGP